jgi:predicted alpha/beta superfamily hydrolase
MVDQWEVEIPTLTGDKKRRAYVYLPVDYDYNDDRRYPVMYMFDGHNVFFDSDATYGRSWRLGDYLDWTHTPLIVAAVECNTEGNCRLSEYSPIDFYFHDEKIKGRGKKYMDWLVGTFKPYIDEHIRTLPDRENTAIAGSSMGGLMTVYALANYNRVFSKGAALSPSLWVGQEGVPQFVEKGKFGHDTILYMDYGSREFPNHGKQRQIYCDTCTTLINKKVNLTSRIVYGGVHSEESWESCIPHFMRALGFEGED